MVAVGAMLCTVLSIHSMIAMKFFRKGGDTKIKEEAERVEIMKRCVLYVCSLYGYCSNFLSQSCRLIHLLCVCLFVVTLLLWYATILLPLLLLRLQHHQHCHYDSLLHDIGNIDHAIKIAFNTLDGRDIDNPALFDNCMLDDNSTISKAEFRKLLLHSRGFHTGDAGDDSVDEHFKHMSEHLSRTVDFEVDTFFQLLDTDKDGVLHRSEFVKKTV